MAEESFLLVSLQDEKAKKLSEVIGNKTAKKILNILAEKKQTESQIAKELNLPISTVHYNLQLLLSSGLVKVNEYHYSSKGKEVNHYEIVNKLIIISPGKEKEGMFDLLKKFLPITLMVGGISLAIELYSRFSISAKAAATSAIENAPIVAPMMAKQAVQNAADSSASVAADAAPSLMAAAPEAVQTAVDTAIVQSAYPNYALWFLIGGLFVIALLFIWELVKRKIKS